ncbi:gephyrin-like molybdotransferase Glp [Niveibacterium sp. SC-1]|uniref:molybdopterin molybdotransferase MoeA n=1 Tax=Niveibacterium sp. SC-1 TaxID=3135646 RepID=UPI00311E4588
MSSSLMSFEAALGALLDAAQTVAETESVATEEALGRVLAQPLRARADVPPADNSAMDGYAVRVADIPEAGTSLLVSQRIIAGATGDVLAPGTVARIFTGAPVPPGCDAVVMQENTRVEGDRVRIEERPLAGQNVRRAGEDIAAGSEVLAAGSVLGPASLGLAASLGEAHLEVRRRLRVAIFFTGNELVMPGEPLGPGQIYNSNRFVLRALLAQLGCEFTDLGIVRDSLDATREALRRAADGHDLVLTCGGVSVGEEDHVKAAVEAEGELNLWKIAIKPGKPLAFGRVGEAAFIGLPGNPVSSFVTFLTLVCPYLLKRQGRAETVWRAIERVAAFDSQRPESRREFLRARLDAQGRVELHPRQGSGVLSSCAWAEGFVELAPGQQVRAGDKVRFLAFTDLGGLR